MSSADLAVRLGAAVLADFLRQESRSIARQAARDAGARMPNLGRARRRALKGVFRAQVEDLARLLELHDDDAPRLFGEHQRRRAAELLVQGRTVGQALEETAALFEAMVDAWLDQPRAPDSGALRLFAAAFAEAAAQVADAWVALLRSEGVAFQEAALLHTIVEHLDEAILVIENDGVVSYATPTTEFVLGVPLRRVVGATAEGLLELLDRVGMRRADGSAFGAGEFPHERAFATRRVVHEEAVTVRRADGQEAVLELIASPVFGEERQLRGLILTMRDLTERERMLRALREAYDELRQMHAEQLERTRLEAVGRLANGAALALNNQLNVLMLRLRHLKELPGAHEDTAALERAGREIARVVRGLQAFAAAPKLRAPEPLDLGPLVREVQVLTRGQFAPLSPVALEVDMAPSPAVRARRDLLLEILTDLLLRERDRAASGGPVRLDVTDDGARVLVRVHGGDPDGERRVDEAMRDDVRRWGGDLTALQGEGGGWELHLAHAERGQAVEAVPAPRAGAVRRALVVDDDTDNADVMAEVLRDAGLEAQTANTGAEAIDVAEKLNPDVALVDLVLPDVQGWEVVRRLRERYPDIRVAVVTGLAAADAPEASMADAVFQKPVEPGALQRFLGA